VYDCIVYESYMIHICTYTDQHIYIYVYIYMRVCVYMYVRVYYTFIYACLSVGFRV